MKVQQTSRRKEENKNMIKGGFCMFKKMKHIKNEKGLTLVELLAVIVILAIIAAIAVPSIGNIVDNSRYSAVKSDAVNVLNAANIYFTDNSGETTVSVGKLVNDKYLESSGKIPGTSAATSATAASATDSIITKSNDGNTLTTLAIKYSGNKTVTFNAAKLTSINADTNKGSGNWTISGTGTAATTQ